MAEVNDQHYTVNTTPTGATFTLKDSGGNVVNTTSFMAHRTGGYVIRTANCPRTVAFLGNARLVYAATVNNPAGLFFSRAPSSSTGATRFDDFTTGSNATDAILYTLAAVFNRQDAIQWISVFSKNIIVGCASSVRRVHGDSVDDPISPSSINATPISNVGAAPVQPFSSGQSIYYVDGLGNRIQSFVFTIQSNDFVTTNQNLTSNQLGAFNFKEIAQQRGDSGLLWVLRQDGILAGLTFNELESIFGWHRHYLGGMSTVNSVDQSRAKVISITVEPRANSESILWALVERKVGANTYRSVEFLLAPARFADLEEFFTGDGYDVQASDSTKYNNANYELLKDSIHVDSALTYDGGSAGASITMTPSAAGPVNATIILTAGSAFFTASMVGRQIWKKYDSLGNGGGRAEITGFTNTTTVTAKVLVAFDSASVIPGGSWFLTTNKVYGLLHLVGQSLSLQMDGSPEAAVAVASDGSLSLNSHASKVHAGFFKNALAMTMNLDVAGARGSAQAKIRKIRQLLLRFHDTVGARVGTTPWNTDPIVFRELDDLTDRPTVVFRGIQDVFPSDSYTRQTKQIVLMQSLPAPQTLLSMDVEVETADD
jgi:hypothetical protein